MLPCAVILFVCPLARAGIAERLDHLDQELNVIEKQGQEILQHQGEVLTKIDALKIRVRRT